MTFLNAHCLFVCCLFAFTLRGVLCMVAAAFGTELLYGSIPLTLSLFYFSHMIDIVCRLGMSCEISLGLTRVR